MIYNSQKKMITGKEEQYNNCYRKLNFAAIYGKFEYMNHWLVD